MRAHMVLGFRAGTRLAPQLRMGIGQQLRQYAGSKMTRRITRAVPWVGGAIALLTLGSTIRRKGFFGGSVDTALDVIPFVGGAKNLAEAARGRDFFPDRH